MIAVEKITTKEIERRFDSLPENLKQALDSEANLKIVDKVCQNHYLAEEEKILMVRQIAALVFLGFIHFYDVAQEINAELELNNPKLADSIAKELDAKIFSPLKDELEKNYHPIEEEKPAAQQIVEEIKKVGAEPAPVPTIISVGPEAAAPRLVPLMQPAQPEIRQVGLKPETPVPPPPKPMEQQTVEPGPAPLILHEEAESRPLKPSSEFHLEFADKFKEAAGPKPSIKPALLEIGSEAETKTQPKVSRTETPEPRVVHYNEFRTPLGKPEQLKTITPQPESAPAKTPLPKPEKTTETAKSISPAAPIQPPAPVPQPPSASPPAPPAPPQQPIKSPEEKIIDLSSL